MLEDGGTVPQWSHTLAVATWKSRGVTINYDCTGGKRSTYDCVIEFGSNLYLIKGGRGSDKGDS